MHIGWTRLTSTSARATRRTSRLGSHSPNARAGDTDPPLGVANSCSVPRGVGRLFFGLCDSDPTISSHGRAHLSVVEAGQVPDDLLEPPTGVDERRRAGRRVV